MTQNIKHGEDEAMGGVEDNMSTTPTGGYNSGYQQSPNMQAENYPPSNGAFSPAPETDPNTRYPSANSGYQQPQPYSRPSSGLSGSGDRYGHSAYQDQSQRSSHQDARTQSSVVIKVGMVGDAQIGKTSLMVKYVEGSWDEDYIQTLGMACCLGFKKVNADCVEVSISWRRPSQFEIRKSLSPFGTLEVSVNSSTCCLLYVMTRLPSCSCST